MHFDQLKRCELITRLGGAAAVWPLAVRAQQAMPVMGYISSLTQADSVHFDAAFRRGLPKWVMSKVRMCGSNTAG